LYWDLRFLGFAIKRRKFLALEKKEELNAGRGVFEMNEDLKRILNQVKTAQAQVERLIQDRSWVQDVRKYADQQKKEVRRLIEKDAQKVKSFLERERSQIEKFQREIPGELEKLARLVKGQKKELNRLIDKVRKNIVQGTKTSQKAAKKAKKASGAKKPRSAKKKSSTSSARA
jgi:enamine deaminase RidA (YjgF/YER057c/UK114 family)